MNFKFVVITLNTRFGGRMAPQDATPEFRHETLEAAAEVAVRKTAHLEMYRGHGNCLLEGLWRKSE
jgi:hypothetical protein